MLLLFVESDFSNFVNVGSPGPLDLDHLLNYILPASLLTELFTLVKAVLFQNLRVCI